jgi:multidrug resistance efflux pump
MKRRAWFIAAGLLVIIAAVWIVLAIRARRAAGEYSGTVETREIQIGSKAGGRVTSVSVEEGQTAGAGTILVRFECDQLEAQHAEATAAITEAQAELERMVRGNRPEEIAQAKAAAEQAGAALDAARNGPRKQEIDQAQADYASAQADAANAAVFYKRMEKLAATDTISRQQFDDARDRSAAAAQKAEAARQQFALLQAGTRPEDLRAAEEKFKQADAARALAVKGSRREDIDAARSRLVQAQARLKDMDAQLNECELKTPADAVVETVSIRPGDLVPPGRIVLSLLEPSQLWVKIYVPETDLARLRLGQSAQVTVDSFPGRGFTGHVGQIASQGEFLPRNVQTREDREHQVFGVKVYVDNAQAVLKSGMAATVRLE